MDTTKNYLIATNVLQICVCVPRKNVHSKAHRLLAHNANVLLYLGFKNYGGL